MRAEDDIQSLRHGVEALRLLGARESLSCTELGAALGLSRAAAYRVVNTLHALGYAARERASGASRYRLAIRVRQLSDGFHGDRTLLHVAVPRMREFTRRESWPLALSTPAGERFFVRYTTDQETSRVLRRYRAGFHRSVLLAGAGLVCLAHEAPGVRQAVLESLARAWDPAAPPVARDPSVPLPHDTAGLESLLERVRTQGWAAYHETGERERSLAIPLHRDGHFVGALTLRYMVVAARERGDHAAFLERLRGLGREIEAELAGHQGL